MEYSIKQTSEKVGLSTYSLRYYEKEGLISRVSRDKRGVRLFTDEDIREIQLIICLRSTGMTIAEIKDYLNLCAEGSQTLLERRAIIKRQEDVTHQKIQELHRQLEIIRKKVEHYDNLINGVEISDSCALK